MTMAKYFCRVTSLFFLAYLWVHGNSENCVIRTLLYLESWQSFALGLSFRKFFVFWEAVLKLSVFWETEVRGEVKTIGLKLLLIFRLYK